MKFILLVVAFLFPALSHSYDCFPSGLLPQLGDGTAWRTTTTPAGFTKSWWCRLPVRQGDKPDKWYWAPQFFPVHISDQDLVKFAAAAGRVATAADPKAQADAEVLAARVAVPAGSRKAYEYAQLIYVACLDLRINPPAGVVFDPKPADWVGPYVTEPAWCGVAPVPPVSTETWRATGGTIFLFNGTRLTASTVRRATAGATCNSSAGRSVVGSSTYMPLASGPLTEATACVKQ